MQRRQDESTPQIRGKLAPLALGSLLLAACTTGNVLPKGNANPGDGDGDMQSSGDGDAGQGAGTDSSTATSDGGNGGDGDGAVTGDGDLGPRAGDKPVLYPADQRHSPITASVAQTLQAILAKGSGVNQKNFVRVGDNNSYSSHLLGCFDPASGKTPKLAADAYAQPTIKYFLGGSINGMNPFAYAVQMENFTPSTVIDDSAGPSWLQQQINVSHPAFALLTFGPGSVVGHAGTGIPTHDDYWIVDDVGPETLAMADALIAQGAIPLIRSTPPYAPGTQDNTSGVGPNMLFPLVNAVYRAVAQGRQVPFGDVYLDAATLGASAFEGDGTKLADYQDNPCDFTATGLAYGDNLVNQVVVEQMHRAKTVAIDQAAPPDADGPTLEGNGTEASPYIARKLPFVDLRALAKAGTRTNYSECPTNAGIDPPDYHTELASSNENAGERIYKYTATKTTKLRAFVFDKKGSPARTFVHHFSGNLSKCDVSHFALLQFVVQPGDHYFVIDGELSSQNGTAEYGFGLVECHPDDPTCCDFTDSTCDSGNVKK